MSGRGLAVTPDGDQGLLNPRRSNRPIFLRVSANASVEDISQSTYVLWIGVRVYVACTPVHGPLQVVQEKWVPEEINVYASTSSPTRPSVDDCLMVTVASA